MQDTIENLEWEIWKDVPWYEWHYIVSNLWNVYSTKSNIELKKHLNKYWYLAIHLHGFGNKKTVLVHRIVSMAFIPNPENKRTVNHINGIRNDNRLSNLEWATHAENNKHAFMFLWKISSSLWKRWFDCKTSKQVNQISLDWKYITTFWSIAEVERILWIYASNVSYCCIWSRKTAWWYKWEYANRNER